MEATGTEIGVFEQVKFSPTALVLSTLITGSALGGLLTAPDRHYRVNVDYHLGSVFWVDKKESSSLSTVLTSANTDICMRPRPFEVDIRLFRDTLSGMVHQTRAHSKHDYDPEFQFAYSISPPPAGPLQYNRKWPVSCGIPNGERMIRVWAVDADMPFDAIPISRNDNEEVSACLKIDQNGRVVSFNFAQPVDKIPVKVVEKIEQAARECWKFDRLSGSASSGWIQVGLDRRIEGDEI